MRVFHSFDRTERPAWVAYFLDVGSVSVNRDRSCSHQHRIGLRIPLYQGESGGEMCDCRAVCVSHQKSVPVTNSERCFWQKTWEELSTKCAGILFFFFYKKRNLTEQEGALLVVDDDHAVLQLRRQVEGEARPGLVGLQSRNLSHHIVQDIVAARDEQNIVRNVLRHEI